MFSTGLMSEILIRTYFESQGRRTYAVRQILDHPPGAPAGTSARFDNRNSSRL
jgi:hypothetical protein